MNRQKRNSSDSTQDPESNKSIFLADLPWQIDLSLKSQQIAQQQDNARELREFAISFLKTLTDNDAIIPGTDTSPPKLLALVLTHHLRNPDSCVAWLNLGLSLRLMAESDQHPVVAGRLQKALFCFGKSLATTEITLPVRIRAWVGKALTFADFQQLEESVQCSREALELDRSDPNLWLLHVSLLERAGRKENALELVDEAYKAYVIAGRPEGLRDLFDSVVSPANTPDPAQHLRHLQ